jgi:hypothetical protein
LSYLHVLTLRLINEPAAPIKTARHEKRANQANVVACGIMSSANGSAMNFSSDGGRMDLIYCRHLAITTGNSHHVANEANVKV